MHTMPNYFDALYQFCLEFKRLENISYERKNLVFLGAAAILGFLIILLDLIVAKLFGKSFLGLHYNDKSQFLLIIVCWTFACTFVSYLGLIMNVFNSTIQSCVIVGISWLYIVIHLAEKIY